jgi:hypothetical protein
MEMANGDKHTTPTKAECSSAIARARAFAAFAVISDYGQHKLDLGT